MAGDSCRRDSSARADRRRRIEQVLKGYPVARRLYRTVSSYISSLGEVEVVPRKTQVGFSHGRLFAWVWLPQRWIKNAPVKGVALTFSLDHRVSDRRIKECVEPYPGRFTHHVVMLAPSDLDARVRGWLIEAYELAGAARQRVGADRLPRR
jgi:hypothetical protein